jgi:hypothetical protein
MLIRWSSMPKSGAGHARTRPSSGTGATVALIAGSVDGPSRRRLRGVEVLATDGSGIGLELEIRGRRARGRPRGYFAGRRRRLRQPERDVLRDPATVDGTTRPSVSLSGVTTVPTRPAAFVVDQDLLLRQIFAGATTGR